VPRRHCFERPGRAFETWSTRNRIVNQVEADQLITAGTTLVLSAL